MPKVNKTKTHKMGILDLFKKKNNETNEASQPAVESQNVIPENAEPLDLSNVSYEEVVITGTNTFEDQQPVNQEETTVAINENNNEPNTQNNNLGNIEFTAIIDNLTEVPVEQRDDKWIEALIHHLPTASLTSGDPQVIGGPDGFPYFQLAVPEKNKEFQCFVLDKMKDDFILEKGFGVVLHPQKNQPDIVLTYGDIVNYHLNRHFFYNDNSFSNETHQTQVEQNEEVMIGDPNETVLPKKTRLVLKDFLAANGIKEPKVLLMMRKKNEQPHRDIVFNITQEMFENEEMYTNVMRAIGWFLPRHYTYLSIQEDTFGEHFKAL